MFYRFLRVLVGFSLKIFFRKIYISGLEHVDSNKAQLIASNHPNGFLEPLIMACFFPKALHFLVRGDVFDNKILEPMLRSTHQIPIFRFKDGFSRLRENSQTIDESLQVLLDKNNLLIFAEGNTQSIKKLRPLQKGISRIAFQTLAKDPLLDLEILPVGINFSYPSKFDEMVMLKIGEPVKARDYYSTYDQDKNEGHQGLLDDLYAAMKKNVVHLEDQNRISFFEKMVPIVRTLTYKSYLPVYQNSETNLILEKDLAVKIDNLNKDKYEHLTKQVSDMEATLSKNSVEYLSIFQKSPSFFDLIILILGIIPAVIGFCIHGLPIGLSLWFTKTKVHQKEFKASILMVSNIALLLLWYILLILVFIIFNIPLYYIILCIILGLWLRYYFVLSKDISFSKSAFKTKMKNEILQIYHATLV